MSSDLAEWIQEWVALVETREGACVADCRRALAAVRETTGPTAYQEHLGKEITEMEEDRQRWEQDLWAGMRQLRKASPSVESVLNFRKLQLN